MHELKKISDPDFEFLMTEVKVHLLFCQLFLSHFGMQVIINHPI